MNLTWQSIIFQSYQTTFLPSVWYIIIQYKIASIFWHFRNDVARVWVPEDIDILKSCLKIPYDHELIRSYQCIAITGIDTSRYFEPSQANRKSLQLILQNISFVQLSIDRGQPQLILLKINKIFINFKNCISHRRSSQIFILKIYIHIIYDFSTFMRCIYWAPCLCFVITRLKQQVI